MIKNKLIELSDLKYKEFQIKLLPKNTKMYGVRLPILRKLSKNITLDELTDESLEELLLQAFIISNIKNKEKLFNEIDEFLPKINNWSICDSFVASLKITKTIKEDMFSYLLQYIDNQNEYIRRFVIVMFLWYYIDYEYIDKIYGIVININKNDYYVKMAISWLISEIFYFNQEYGIRLISNINDEFIIKKAISKIKESNKKSKVDISKFG